MISRNIISSINPCHGIGTTALCMCTMRATQTHYMQSTHASHIDHDCVVDGAVCLGHLSLVHCLHRLVLLVLPDPAIHSTAATSLAFTSCSPFPLSCFFPRPLLPPRLRRQLAQDRPRVPRLQGLRLAPREPCRMEPHVHRRPRCQRRLTAAASAGRRRRAPAAAAAGRAAGAARHSANAPRGAGRGADVCGAGVGEQANAGAEARTPGVASSAGGAARGGGGHGCRCGSCCCWRWRLSCCWWWCWCSGHRYAAGCGGAWH